MTVHADLQGRALACANGTVPAGVARSQAFKAQMRAQQVERDGKAFYQLDGYASVVERAYPMWDFFGEYKEVVDLGAFDVTLRNKPDVAYLINHTGMTLARTTAGTLELSADDTGLLARAYLNPKRSDVSDLVTAIEDRNITEMSFAFTITDGAWSPDYTEYRITGVDLEKGDVSAVNYGANPHTMLAARAHEALTALDKFQGPDADAARGTLLARLRGGPAEGTQLRVGAVLDAPTMTSLGQVLDLISSADGAVDVAQALLADLMGVPCPDADEMKEMSRPSVALLRMALALEG